MDRKLVELSDNYNYLLDAVKNNQMTPDDAVRTLDSLSIIENNGRIWKINIYGEFIAGFPGGDLIKADPNEFNIGIQTNKNIYEYPPVNNIISEVKPINKKNKRIRKNSNDNKLKKENLKKLRTPLIILVSIIVGFNFYNSSKNDNEKDSSKIVNSEYIDSEEVISIKENIYPELESNNEKDEIAKEDMVGSESDIKFDTNNFNILKKEIENILTNLDKDKYFNKMSKNNESYEMLLLKRAQLVGYISVGFDIKINSVNIINKEYVYYVDIIYDKKIIMSGTGKIYEIYNDNYKNFTLSWPALKRIYEK